MKGSHTPIRRVGELGRPGTPSHAVVFEKRVNRRQVIRFIVPFLVASLGVSTEKRKSKQAK